MKNRRPDRGGGEVEKLARSASSTAPSTSQILADVPPNLRSIGNIVAKLSFVQRAKCLRQTHAPRNQKD